MSKLKSPAYQWYPRDYIASTRVTMMSLVEEAIYRRLLDYCWLEGSISSDPNKIKRLIGKEATLEDISEVLTMFSPHPEDDSKLTHERLDMQRKEKKEFSNKMSEAAKKRWQKSGNAKAMPTHSLRNAKAMPTHSLRNAKAMPTQCSTTTSTTTSTTNNNSTSNTDSESNEVIERIYQAYPKKVGKPQALKSISKALKQITADELLTLTNDYATARHGADPKFTPNPSTWFNQERFRDDPSTWKETPKVNHGTNHRSAGTLNQGRTYGPRKNEAPSRHVEGL